MSKNILSVSLLESDFAIIANTKSELIKKISKKSSEIKGINNSVATIIGIYE